MASLQRLLGKSFSIAACIGLVIGLGILRTPGEIATTVSDPVPYMALWIGCGFFALLSVLVVAELIAMTPRSGGIYALVRHAYGRYPGFLIGWTDWISGCATLALKTVVLVEYVALLVPVAEAHQVALRVGITSAFALMQLAGTRTSAGVQRVASAGIGLIIFALAIALYYGFFVNKGVVDVPVQAGAIRAPGMAALGLVVASVVFTYDGWYAASYFSGEVKSGGRSVAIGSIQGALIIMALYVALNLALVLSVPLLAIAGNKLALAGALELVFGAGAGTLIVGAAIFILLAHQNLQYMMISRILYSLSVDGLGLAKATSVNERGAPAGAMIISWLTVVALVIAGQFAFLLNMVTILFMAMYVSLVIGVFRLRRSEPDAERPFKAWGFPATGVICALGWTVIALFVAVSNPESAISGAALVIISAPVYLWLRRYRHLDENEVAEA